uniref:Phosphatidylinositol 3,4,5-trisphosphate 3-phosphatase and dual-specificity protein phosphatase PTEN n=1 Tax=Lotharella globosa TaxID=91324 RepID=A0A7S4DZQ8_9EUKA
MIRYCFPLITCFTYPAASYEDEEEDKEDVRIMRGRVIGSDPVRVGLFPSSYVRNVTEVASDYSRPDEKRQKTVLGLVRSQVSKKKRRFMADGFDLDLSYITPKIIAMGIPASDMSAFYRNNLDEVIKFLEHFHKDHYQLYNLCDDRSYPTKKFHDRVVQYGFEDHNPCPFDMMEPFCRHLHQYLAMHEKNVAAIHCKAGKGRTGLMISAYLIYNKQHQDSFSALRYFAVKRTKNCKGVTIPSQMRYVDYFRRYLEMKRTPSRLKIPRQKSVGIISIALSPFPKHLKEGYCTFNVDQFSTCELTGVNKLKSVKNKDRIDVKEGSRPPDAVLKNLVHSSKVMKKITPIIDSKAAMWMVRGSGEELVVDDDVRVTFVFRGRYSMKRKKVFQAWFNTRFLDFNLRGEATLRLQKSQIDKICKDLKHKVVPENFTMTIHFQAS